MAFANKWFTYICIMFISYVGNVNASNSNKNQVATINNFPSLQFCHLLPFPSPTSNSSQDSSMIDVSASDIDENKHYHIQLFDFKKLVQKLTDLIELYPNNRECLKKISSYLDRLEVQTNKLLMQTVLPSYKLIQFISPIPNDEKLSKSNFDNYLLSRLSDSVFGRTVNQIFSLLRYKYYLAYSEEEVQKIVAKEVKNHSTIFQSLLTQNNLLNTESSGLSARVWNEISKTYYSFTSYIQKYFDSIQKCVDDINTIMGHTQYQENYKSILPDGILKKMLAISQRLQDLCNIIENKSSPDINNMISLLNKYHVLSNYNDSFMQNPIQSIIQLILKRNIDSTYDNTEMELCNFHINYLTSEEKYITNIKNDTKKNLKHMHNYLAQICKLITYDTNVFCNKINYYEKDNLFEPMFFESAISNIEYSRDLKKQLHQLYYDQYETILRSYKNYVLMASDIQKSYKFQALKGEILQYIKQYNDMCCGKLNLQEYDFSKVLKDLESKLDYLNEFLKPFSKFLSKIEILQNTFSQVVESILDAHDRKYGVVFCAIKHCHNMLSRIHDYYQDIIIGADNYLEGQSVVPNEKLLYEMRHLYVAAHNNIKHYQYNTVNILKVTCAKLLEYINFDKADDITTLVRDCLNFCCIDSVQLTEHINDFYRERDRILSCYSQQTITDLIQNNNNVVCDDENGDLLAEFSTTPWVDMTPISHSNDDNEDTTAEAGELKSMLDYIRSDNVPNILDNNNLKMRNTRPSVETHDPKHQSLIETISYISEQLPILDKLHDVVYKMEVMDCYYHHIEDINHKIKTNLGQNILLFVQPIMKQFKDNLDDMKQKTRKCLEKFRLMLLEIPFCVDKPGLLNNINDYEKTYNNTTLSNLIANVNNHYAFLLYKISQALNVHEVFKDANEFFYLFVKSNDKKDFQSLLSSELTSVSAENAFRLADKQSKYLPEAFALYYDVNDTQDLLDENKKLLQDVQARIDRAFYNNDKAELPELYEHLNTLEVYVSKLEKQLTTLLQKQMEFDMINLQNCGTIWSLLEREWTKLFRNNMQIFPNISNSISYNYLADWYINDLYSKFLCCDDSYLSGIYKFLKHNYYQLQYTPGNGNAIYDYING